MGLVDTNQNFYRPFGIKYKGLKLLDVAQTNIAMYFAEVAEYIDEALKSGGNELFHSVLRILQRKHKPTFFCLLNKFTKLHQLENNANWIWRAYIV